MEFRCCGEEIRESRTNLRFFGQEVLDLGAARRKSNIFLRAAGLLWDGEEHSDVADFEVFDGNLRRVRLF